ncbi:hypothetical protein TPHA_0A00790 [Tetrapisispora phaffii CBS 4417]|uniref:Ras-GAP domain-containing protein n=1 Tax=Tetrapisispora phaffii (strain ATCC 24235 / CBS 4417 / NBRC 1672 / NRRL Y-8282 / UCD 70-5) TaxID=1071381 RepID=G8BMN6_TETPH|nr:hypothetical protein TPHA_0A00790 [Tetrapisispora phaffii CBS 4417]CCE61164.1 hypothetical protein TPHA_0A00790 [Tetrapisispora phaffii CBS 4417]
MPYENGSPYDKEGTLNRNVAMTTTLVRHLLKERIYQLLPINSSYSTYIDVEADVYFLSSRSVLLNVAISQDIEPIVTNVLDLIDLVLQFGLPDDADDDDATTGDKLETITDSHVGDQAVQSICLLLRLLTDILEYNWDFVEKSMADNKVASLPSPTEDIIKIFEKQHNSFSGIIAGFSVHRTNFHEHKPKELNQEVATRLMTTLTRLKFQHVSFNLLTIISKNSPYFKSSLSFNDLIPNYEYFKTKINAYNVSNDLDSNNNNINPDTYSHIFELGNKIDSTITYIQRFVAASNSKEYKKHLTEIILNPITNDYIYKHRGSTTSALPSASSYSNDNKKSSPSTGTSAMPGPSHASKSSRSNSTHSASSFQSMGISLTPRIESDANKSLQWNEVLKNFDLFGCFFLSNTSLLGFLEMLKKLCKTLNRSIFTCVLLFYATKTLMYWIMARSRSFIEVSNSLIDINNIKKSPKFSASTDVTTLTTEQQTAMKLLNTFNELFYDLYTTFKISSVLTNPQYLPNMHTEYTTSPQPKSSNTVHMKSHVPPSNKASPINTDLRFSYNSESDPKLDYHMSSPPPTPLREKNMSPVYGNISYTNSIEQSFNGDALNSDDILMPNPVSLAYPHNKYVLSAMKSFELSQQISNSEDSSDNNIDNMENSENITKDSFLLPPTSISNRVTPIGRELNKSTTSSSSSNNTIEYNEKDVSHLKNVLDLYSAFDESESLVHTSILKFLATISMLDPELFQKINESSFNGIPDIDENNKIVKNNQKAYSSENAITIKNLSHGLKKLTNLKVHKTTKTSKALELLEISLNIYNGTQTTSDNAMIISLRILLTIYTLSASVSLSNKKLACVNFSRRLMPTFYSSLKVDSKAKLLENENKQISKILKMRHKLNSQFQLEFIAASLQLSTDDFLDYLGLDELCEKLDTRKLVLYTEGLRVFFHLPCCENLRKRAAIKLAKVFKKIFYNISEILLKELPIINDDNVSKSIESIIDGTIVNEFGPKSLFKPVSPSTGVVTNQSDTGSTPISLNNHLEQNQGNWVTHPIIASLASPSFFSPSGSAEIISRDIPSVNNELSLISPTAQRAPHNFLINKKHPLISNSARTNGSPISTPGTSKSSANPLLCDNSRQTPGSKLTDDDLSSLLKKKITSNLESSNDILLIGHSTEINNARRIIINIFSIFRKTANFIILPQNEDIERGNVETDFKQIVKPIFVSIIDIDPVLETTACSFMNMLITYMSHLPNNISSNALVDYNLFCSYSITLFSTALFDLNLPNRKREVFLDIVNKLMELKNSVLKLAGKAGRLERIIPVEKNTFVSLTSTLNRGLFVSLHTNKSNIQSLLTKTFSHFTDSINFYKSSIGEITENEFGNIDFIRAMSKGTYVLSGSVAFQRKCRTNILKYITKPDMVLYDCFHTIFNRWLHISKAVTLSRSDIADFRSCAGLLATASGTLLTMVEDDQYNSSISVEIKTDISRKVNYFIGKQCQWLNNEHLLTRENSRDILSSELHPLSFKLLFHNLKKKMVEIKDVDLSNDKADYYFIILEQISIIIRTILHQPYSKDLLFLFSMEIINFIDDLVILVEKISHKSLRYRKGIIYLSKMFKAIEDAEECLAIKGHYALKNRWLKVLIFWFQYSISKELDFDNLSKPHRDMNLPKRDEDMLYLDTSIESSKAIAYLTNGILLEAAYSASKEEYRRSIGFEFRNYFGILLKGIEKTIDIKNCPISLKHKINTLNENLSISLQNLSKANIEPALQYTLHMGYSENIDIRKSFLNVFINVVKNYPSHVSSQQKEKNEATESILTFLIENVQIVSYSIDLCEPSEMDGFAVSMLTTFESRNAGHIIVSQLIKEEIQKAPRSMDILRRNSIATRSLSIFSKAKGREFLIALISPILDELIESKDCFEIEKLSIDDKNTKTQILIFKKYLVKFLNSMKSSMNIFPPELLYICQMIYEEVSKRFPESALVAVGSFVFLRFICPALVSPETEDISSHMDAPVKRSLVQLAKIIQNLANSLDSTSKFTILQSEQDFLIKCNKEIFSNLKELSNLDRNIDIKWYRESQNNDVKLNFDFFHRFYYDHCLQLRGLLLSNLHSLDDIKLLKHSLFLSDRVLGVLGQPNWQATIEIPKFIKDNMEKYSQLYEFVSRTAIKASTDNTNLNSKYVYELMSTDGNPVLALDFKKYKQEGASADLLAYRTIQVYSRFWTSKHYILLNLSEYDHTDEITYSVIFLLLKLIPEEAYQTCFGVYNLNATKSFIQFWNNNEIIENRYVTFKCPYHFVNTINDEQLISDLGFRQQILYLIDDMRVLLNDIELYDVDSKSMIPVTMSLGNRYFQILREEEMDFKPSGDATIMRVKTNQVFEISDVRNVSVSYSQASLNEFTINLINEEILTLTSPKYLEIIKMFSFSIAKSEDDVVIENLSTSSRKENGLTSFEFNLETISHIFVVAIVGLFSEDNEVKNNAYNLLAETQIAFKLDFGVNLRFSRELYVPDDCSMFVKQITQALSVSSPELTGYTVKMVVDALENEVFKPDRVPQLLSCLNYWIPNLYEYVYLADEENGPEAFSYLIKVLIRLTLADSGFTSIYLQQIWNVLSLENPLTSIIVEEVINYALDRDSENGDWACALPLIASMSTVDITAYIVRKLMDLLESFLPSFHLDVSTHSWSELTILVRIAIPLFFESPLLAQMFLPDILFIISLLIDQGPKSIRGYFHELLMNVCHSLAINESLSESNRRALDNICSVFSQQKGKFTLGFRHEISILPQNLSNLSFANKFNILEHFITNILLTMENADEAEAAYWKTKYKKYLMDSIFNNRSYLSARSMMILGIIGKYDTSEMLCKNMLTETLEAISSTDFNEENMFLVTAHIFTYTKVVQGLDPSLDIMNRIFWYGTTLVESQYPILFEGGLFLIGNCLKRLYMYIFESGNSSVPLKRILLESRNFAVDLFSEFDRACDITWTEDSFPLVLISILLRGLSVPFMKPKVIESLEQFLRNAYFESRTKPEVTDYLPYMFLMYLLSPGEQFATILDTIEFEDEIICIDENLKIPKKLLDWLASDSIYSNISLYQAAALFNSNVSDESTKYRFTIITKHLLNINPYCVFKYYTLTRSELRKVSIWENDVNVVKVSFEIITELVQFDEFDDLNKYFLNSQESIKRHGLSAVADVRPLTVNNTGGNPTAAEQEGYHYTFMRRRKFMARLLTRLIYAN